MNLDPDSLVECRRCSKIMDSNVTHPYPECFVNPMKMSTYKPNNRNHYEDDWPGVEHVKSS